MKPIVRNENYIGALNKCLKVKDDFKSLEYYRNAKGDEYMVMSDIIGQVLILNITGYNEEQILHDVAKVLCAQPLRNEVRDPEERLKVARLFK